MTVNRPVQIDAGGEAGVGGPMELSNAERKRLGRRAPARRRSTSSELGDPGDKFETDHSSPATSASPPPR